MSPPDHFSGRPELHAAVRRAELLQSLSERVAEASERAKQAAAAVRALGAAIAADGGTDEVITLLIQTRAEEARALRDSGRALEAIRALQQQAGRGGDA